MQLIILILEIVVSLFIGFIAGTLAGSQYIRFHIYGKIIWKKVLKKHLISAKSVCCKNFICKDGLMAIHGLKLKNETPFIHISDCWINLSKAFGSWVMHWQSHYDKRLSRTHSSGKTDFYNGSINELIDEYAERLDKYARYPKSRSVLPKHSGRIIEILAEVRKWDEKKSSPLEIKDVFDLKKDVKYHLMISEPDLNGKAHLTPVTIEEGWEGSVVVLSDEFGLLEVIRVKIPESPEKYVDWNTNLEIPEEEKGHRGQPLRLKITGIS